MFISRLYRAIKKRVVAYWLVHVAYRYTPEVQFPMDEYTINGDPFGKRCEFDGRDWGFHMGEDCNKPTGTPVYAIGRGRVVYINLHPGKKEKRNWGNLIVIAHKNPITKHVFFSVYGHLANPRVKKGDAVDKGQTIAEIAPPLTAENGWWEDAHLHLGIYTGRWNGNVIPGYYREDQKLTRQKWWHDPSRFIATYSV